MPIFSINNSRLSPIREKDFGLEKDILPWSKLSQRINSDIGFNNKLRKIEKIEKIYDKLVNRRLKITAA